LPSELSLLLPPFIECLQKNRCLIILDSLEAILQEGQRAGEYEPDFVGYGQALSYVGKTEHQSCILITSLENPKEVRVEAGDSASVRSLQLGGVDTGTARMVLEPKNLSGTTATWDRLVETLSGNLELLKIVASAIGELYLGDIDRFLNTTDTAQLGDIQDLLDRQFARLTSLEQSLLNWLAVERAPRGVEALHQNFVGSVSINDIMNGLISLRSRSLVTQTEMGFFQLHSVISNYLLDRLIRQMSAEVISGNLEIGNQYPLMKAQSEEYVRLAQRKHIEG